MLLLLFETALGRICY